MINYRLSFRGKKTKTALFKNSLYNYINNGVTKFFTYDGEVLEFSGEKEDYDKVVKFANYHNGEVVEAKE